MTHGADYTRTVTEHMSTIQSSSPAQPIAMVSSSLEKGGLAMDVPAVLPAKDELELARQAITRSLPQDCSTDEAAKIAIKRLLPGLNNASKSSRYYGFVIGGATPIAKFADNIVTDTDQNVHVHLPEETIATDIEDAALRMLCQLVNLDPEQWTHRTFTTGATASNLVGLSCGKEYVIQKAGQRLGKCTSVAQFGLLKAMREAELDDIQILTTVPHSSIKKVASIIGLGHTSVVDVGRKQPNQRHLFDFGALEESLKRIKDGVASIIAVSSTEVNLGLFATEGLKDFQRLRKLADEYNAWIHVDAAIGLIARVLDETEHSQYARILEGVKGLELADSITGDAHKLLNVPYDCGIALSRHLEVGTQVFQNPGAVYLTGGASGVPTPLNIGIENSRRFRALPVYANLLRYGRAGYQEMLIRQIELAREVARFIQKHEAYELLPPFVGSNSQIINTQMQIDNTFMIVCFRTIEESARAVLTEKIKATKLIYVSGTTFWDGSPAVRIAVSNWQADVASDFKYIEQVLNSVC